MIIYPLRHVIFRYNMYSFFILLIYQFLGMVTPINLSWLLFRWFFGFNYIISFCIFSKIWIFMWTTLPNQVRHFGDIWPPCSLIPITSAVINCLPGGVLTGACKHVQNGLGQNILNVTYVKDCLNSSLLWAADYIKLLHISPKRLRFMSGNMSMRNKQGWNSVI